MRKMLPAFVILTLFLVVCFCLLYRSRVSANTISLADVSKVESILVKDGDTLSSIAEKYAPEKSHVTAKEYMQQIISLNDLKSEYIKTGHYILIPNYQS